MLEWRLYDIRFRLSFLFPATVIVLLSLDPRGTAALCLLASLIHELGHITVMLCLRDRPACVTLGVFGMRMERRSMQRLGYGALCAVSLAGPLANAACALVLSGEAALVHGVMAVTHILPVVSLDGGEALYALLCTRLSEQQADTVLQICSATVLLPLTVLGVCVLFNGGYNFTLLILCFYLILRMFLRRGH